MGQFYSLFTGWFGNSNQKQLTYDKNYSSSSASYSTRRRTPTDDDDDMYLSEIDTHIGSKRTRTTQRKSSMAQSIYNIMFGKSTNHDTPPGSEEHDTPLGSEEHDTPLGSEEDDTPLGSEEEEHDDSLSRFKTPTGTEKLSLPGAKEEEEEEEILAPLLAPLSKTRVIVPDAKEQWLADNIERNANTSIHNNVSLRASKSRELVPAENARDLPSLKSASLSMSSNTRRKLHNSNIVYRDETLNSNASQQDTASYFDQHKDGEKRLLDVPYQNLPEQIRGTIPTHSRSIYTDDQETNGDKGASRSLSRSASRSRSASTTRPLSSHASIEASLGRNSASAASMTSAEKIAAIQAENALYSADPVDYSVHDKITADNLEEQANEPMIIRESDLDRHKLRTTRRADMRTAINARKSQRSRPSSASFRKQLQKMHEQHKAIGIRRYDASRAQSEQRKEAEAKELFLKHQWEASRAASRQRRDDQLRQVEEEKEALRERMQQEKDEIQRREQHAKEALREEQEKIKMRAQQEEAVAKHQLNAILPSKSRKTSLFTKYIVQLDEVIREHNISPEIQRNPAQTDLQHIRRLELAIGNYLLQVMHKDYVRNYYTINKLFFPPILDDDTLHTCLQVAHHLETFAVLARYYILLEIYQWVIQIIEEKHIQLSPGQLKQVYAALDAYNPAKSRATLVIENLLTQFENMLCSLYEEGKVTIKTCQYCNPYRIAASKMYHTTMIMNPLSTCKDRDGTYILIHENRGGRRRHRRYSHSIKRRRRT
jgi:hypothetical protein